MDKCVFKNFKKCYYQKGEEYNYIICTACLLSRIEKLLFNTTHSIKPVNEQTGSRVSKQTVSEDSKVS